MEPRWRFAGVTTVTTPRDGLREMEDPTKLELGWFEPLD
jgi:hypothetical protein